MNDSDKISIDKIIENIIYLHPLISKNLTRPLRTQTNLNPGNLYILGLLTKYDVLSMSQIGCKLSIPKPHVTAQVDKLIAEGMVERLFDPTDRRIVNVRLTEKGKEDFKIIKQDISSGMRSRIQKLDETKLSVLFESIQKVKDILSEVMEDSNKGEISCSKK